MSSLLLVISLIISILYFSLCVLTCVETMNNDRVIKKSLFSKYTGMYYLSVFILKIMEPIDEDKK